VCWGQPWRGFTDLPLLSLSNEGVVYIMGKVGRREEKALVLSINMMRRKLEGVAMFDAERMVGVTFSYTCTQSRIPEYLNPGDHLFFSPAYGYF